MMLPHGKEITCPHAMIEPNEMFGIPFLGFPCVTQVLITEVGIRYTRITEMAYMPIVISAALEIHATGIPVTSRSLTLGIPMCPNTKFDILIPFRTLPLSQIIPIRSVFPRCNRHILCVYRKRGQENKSGQILSQIQVFIFHIILTFR